MAAPPDPEQRLHRILRLARMDGWCLVAIAVPGALLSAATADWTGTAAGLAVAAAGAAELHGRDRLRRGRLAGVAWMVAAQVAVLLTLLVYARWVIAVRDPAELIAHIPGWLQSRMDEALLEPADVRDLVELAQRATAVAVAVAALLYQGGLALHYARSRPLLARALALPPRLGPGR